MAINQATETIHRGPLKGAVPRGAMVVSSQSGVSELRVVTEIRPPDPQAGMKSTQVALVDRNRGELLETGYKTGVTKVFGEEFGSRGDAFSVGVRRTGPSLTVDMMGETASRLFPFMINYDLDLRFNPRSGRWSVSGTHDGYPSYVVTVDGVVGQLGLRSVMG